MIFSTLSTKALSSAVTSGASGRVARLAPVCACVEAHQRQLVQVLVTSGASGMVEHLAPVCACISLSGVVERLAPVCACVGLSVMVERMAPVCAHQRQQE